MIQIRVILPQAENPKNYWQQQELEERHGTDSSSELSKGTNLVHILGPDFWLPEHLENKFLCLCNLVYEDLL